MLVVEEERDVRVIEENVFVAVQTSKSRTLNRRELHVGYVVPRRRLDKLHFNDSLTSHCDGLEEWCSLLSSGFRGDQNYRIANIAVLCVYMGNLVGFLQLCESSP